ncbi:oxygenase MpaB family protein [Streptomyces erythrochromogenes]|uniref:oxygenase MpaB family protein n=1 Tax=Streptomyces erythrochromogenes TaxID=285574 RepID=UPI00099CE21C|nr:oxygenase MpaB family protein [Streptomyces erythrochromogenes]
MDQFVTRRTVLAAAAAGVAAAGLPAVSANAQDRNSAIAAEPTPWELPGDQAATEGDPEADAVIDRLVREGQMAVGNQVFHAWTRNDQPVPDAAPAVLRDFLQRNAVLTAEERLAVDRLAHGDTIKLLQSNMEVFTMAEAFGGLFAALADPLLAKSVWYAKYDLVMDIGRRFSRTMNTMWDMLGTNSWDPSGNAVITLVKLRLVHAAARHMGLAHGWDTARDGMPISQRLEVEELMYVGAYNVHLAAKYDFHLTAQQVDELMALVRVGGRLLGIDEKYNPRTIDQANLVLADAAEHHRASSDEGIKLARNMLDWMDRKIFPGAGALGASMVRMMDAHVADVLRIPANPPLDTTVATLGPYLYRPAYEVQQKFPLLASTHAQMFKIASQIVAWYAVDFRDYDLQMPTGRPTG